MRGQSISGVSYLSGQLEIPGTAPSSREALMRQAAEPLKPKAPQAPCDIGLFGDDAAQLDLVEMFMVENE